MARPVGMVKVHYSQLSAAIVYSKTRVPPSSPTIAATTLRRQLASRHLHWIQILIPSPQQQQFHSCLDQPYKSTTSSSPRSPLLLTLPHITSPLPLQKLLLLLCAHTPQLPVPLLPLLLVTLSLALLRLLILVCALNLAHLFFARCPNVAEGFGAVVGRVGEDVGEAQEVGEDWNCAVVGCEVGARGQTKREGDSLFGDCVVESVVA